MSPAPLICQRQSLYPYIEVNIGVVVGSDTVYYAKALPKGSDTKFIQHEPERAILSRSQEHKCEEAATATRISNLTDNHLVVEILLVFINPLPKVSLREAFVTVKHFFIGNETLERVC